VPLCHTQTVRRAILFPCALFSVLFCLLAASCSGNDEAGSGRQVFPTARPAPTIAGEVVEAPAGSVGELQVIGASTQQSHEIRALPGDDKPLLGATAPGANIGFFGDVFAAEDGVVWYRVAYESFQGWIKPQVGHQGPAMDVTEQAMAAIGATTSYPSAEALATAVGDVFASAVGAPETTLVSAVNTDGTSLSTVIVDILGLADDPQLGFRIEVSADGRTGQWLAESVLQSPLCARGVTPKGTCI